MNNVTIANNIANEIVNTEVKGLGFHTFTAEAHKALMPLIMEADMKLPEGESLTPRDIAELALHPTMLAIMERIDRQLYKIEYIAMFKQQMAEMGLEGVDGAKELIGLSNAQMVEFAGQDYLDKALNMLGGLGHECHAAVLASFTH